MPIPTPFHQRTEKLCTSKLWKDWSGYFAVSSYQSCHEQEYIAYRHSAGLMDVTPLCKYEVHGPEALAYLCRVMAKDISKLEVGQVTYCCWCDDHGKILDDGTVTRVDEHYYRITAAEPSFHWFQMNAQRYAVTIEDSTARHAVLALQGPLSRDILRHAIGSGIDDLKFFWTMITDLAGCTVTISRTGYTGDLGYEIWCKNSDALAVYDTLFEAGQNYCMLPAALAALDVTRLEAGFIMNGVDYFSANHCIIESRKSSPYEIGLGWTIDLNRDPFIGQAALQKTKRLGSKLKLVGLEYDWTSLERAFAEHELPPTTPHGAWRTALPVYGQNGRQVGQATSGTWAPMLKKNIALASIESAHATLGSTLQIEVTVEYQRQKTAVTIAKPMFFNPQRKRN